jgi:OmcA/MtrC family decaheme c-type cytochrome
MKFSTARVKARSQVPLIAVLALAATIGLAGCVNGGGDGPAGPGGGGGGTGPTGPTGPSDVPILQGGPVRDVGTGSALTAQQIADIGKLVATLDSAAVSGNKPVIDVTVKTDRGGPVLGLAASTPRLGVAKLVPAQDSVPSHWQSYINRTGTPNIATPALASAVQANTETGIAAGWTELGAGRYRYTSAVDLTQVTTPIAVTFEPALTHRLAIAIDLAGGARGLAPDNPYKDFVPSGGAVTADKLIAATDNCKACHVRFAEHGGPRRNVEFCVICHNPGTVDPDSGEALNLAYMAHSIHRGKNRSTGYVVYGYNGAKFDTSNVTYPQPISFCETCHTKSVAMPQGDDWMAYPNAPACGGCHAAGLLKTGPGATTGLYAYTYTHSTPSLPPDFHTFNDGECKGCHKAGGTAGDVLDTHKRDAARKAIENGNGFEYKILTVENAAAGEAPKVTFQILGAGGTPINVKAISTGRLRLDFAWAAREVHNIADIAGDQYQADRGQALVVDLIANMASVVDNGNGTYSYTLSQVLPAAFDDATLGKGLAVVLEGRRVMPDGSLAYPASAYAFAGGAAREKLVDQAKCEACHKRLALHGGSRAGDPMICTICHNSSVGGAWPASGGGTEDFGPLALGAFIHNVHNSKIVTVGAITYPQSLARCTGCHVDGKFNLARTSALPMTVDAGTTLSSGATTLAWKDDLADSATAGTCKSCHDSSAAQEHMTTQGGTFGVAKALVPSSSAEGCAFCHGPGRGYDTEVKHCSTLPYGQCK